jgi:alpha-D-ribose 1-methylphosphonate 5-triphosphate synthase subunit PhnG
MLSYNTTTRRLSYISGSTGGGGLSYMLSYITTTRRLSYISGSTGGGGLSYMLSYITTTRRQCVSVLDILVPKV